MIRERAENNAGGEPPFRANGKDTTGCGSSGELRTTTCDVFNHPSSQWIAKGGPRRSAIHNHRVNAPKHDANWNFYQLAPQKRSIHQGWR